MAHGCGRAESPFNPGLRKQLSYPSAIIQLRLPDGRLRGQQVDSARW